MHAAACLGANAASLHGLGRRARARVDAAAQALLAAVRLPEAEVIFTSSRAEALALAVLGLARAQPKGRREVLLGEALQRTHPALRPLLLAHGFSVHLLEPDADGAYTPEALQHFLHPHVALVSLPLCDDFDAMVQPHGALAAVCGAAKVPLHFDVGPALGRLPLTDIHPAVSAMSVDARPLGGPAGIAALLLRQGADLVPIWGGGGQFEGLRPGSEAVPLAAGLAVALGEVQSDLLRQSHLHHLAKELRDGLAARLVGQGSKGMRLLPPGGASCLGHQLGLQVPVGLVRDPVAALRRLGIRCGGWTVAAKTPEDTRAPFSTVQFAFGYGNKEGDVAAALAAIDAMCCAAS